MGVARDDPRNVNITHSGMRAVQRHGWLARLQKDPSIAKRWFGTRAEIDAIAEAEHQAWKAAQTR